ncbi:hypothetical protein Tco_0230981 [Tanacetum coccineum]
MQAARDRQKSYADLKCKPMEFQVGDKVMLKVSPWKGVVRFGKRGKLNPRYVGPFKVLGKVGEFMEEPVEIIDREVKRLKHIHIPLIKVRWNSKRGPEFTWEREDQFRKKYPHLLAKTAPSSSTVFGINHEPTISSLDDEIDFRISFDESDDEDYTVVFDKNSFSYKIISTNDLKTDSENDIEKVNMPLFPSPEPSVSCIDYLDIFKDFENEFPAIVYNDVLTSKSDFSTELTLCPQHIDEFDLNDETSLNVVEAKLFHPVIRGTSIFIFEGLLDTEGDIANFEMRLARIYKREVHRDQGQSVFTSWALRRLFDIRGPLVHELILKFLRTAPSYTFIWDPMLRLCHKLIACSIVGRSQAPEKVTMTDLFYLRGMDVGSVNVPYLLDRYLRLFASGRKQGEMISRVRELPVIDMAELVRLQICVELDNTWVWVPARPARQEGEAGGVAEEAPVALGCGDKDEELPQAIQREVLDSMAHDFSRFTTWTVTSLARLMDRAGVPYTRYSESPVEYEIRTRRRSNDSSTFAAPHQPDP